MPKTKRKDTQMSGFTREEQEKRLAWLRSENEKAETWGAGIAARDEEIREIEALYDCGSDLKGRLG